MLAAAFVSRQHGAMISMARGSSFLLWLGLGGAALSGQLAAQTRDDGGLWLMWFGHGRLGAADSALGDWRWWADAQPRWLGEGDRYDTTLLRPGLGYAFDSRTTLWAGYAWIESDPVGREAFVEQRAWQQLTWNAPVEGFTLLSRTRLEERFVEGRGETGWRLRQLFKVTVPVSGDGDLFVSAWDEVFHDLHDTDWGQRRGLRQNRAFAGLGVRLSEQHNWTLEVGYLNQWLNRPGTDGLNHILSVNVLMAF